MSHRIAPQPVTRVKSPRKEQADHLAFIRQLPCVICGKVPSQAAHVRFADARYGKQVGMQEKPDDKFTTPLCDVHHRSQHSIREIGFWEDIGIDPHALALALHSVSGDLERGRKIIEAWREWHSDPFWMR